MITLLRREFIVNQPIQRAWQHLARIEEWPSWARHIKQIEIQPPGALGPKSTGFIQLRNGMKPAFSVTEFNPYRNWKRVGKFLWATVHYEHQFEEQNPTQTKFTWIVEAIGFGESVIGRIFAQVYKKDLDRAIPSLVAEINASGLAWRNSFLRGRLGLTCKTGGDFDGNHCLQNGAGFVSQKMGRFSHG